MLPTRSLRSMKGRLALLAENARQSKDEPLAGKIFDENGEEIVQALNFDQVKKQNQREEDEFHKKYPRHIAYSKMPSYASKQDRLIAETVPWTGEEGFEQGVLRMLEDAHKPLRTQGGQGVPLPKRAPKVSVSDRLSGARDKSLDYTMDKVTGTKPQPDEEMSATRRRALDSMGTLNGPVILSGIQSIADQRIEDARKRGQFDGIKRGVPLDLKHSSNPMIDDTEYFLNSMLKRQNILPPWIERQTKLGVKTDRLISDMRISYIRHVVHSLVRKSKRLEDVLAIVDKHDYTKGDPIWEQGALKYHETALEGLSSSIRSYNLQAPQPARRGYLSYEDIMKCVYSDVDKAIRQEVIREMTAEKKKPQLYERKEIRERELPKWRVKDMWGHLFG
ncbi:hypothetical protein CJU89_0038 [Yarrowia sp. B02]|nr:hypothetical protein CJU89_0038 [Yarrowia sp. B02]